jgi:lysophospholipid acyltransferase (LPLAT)-like uncharacterized protein
MSASPQSKSTRSGKKRSGGIVVPHAPRWHQRLGAWLVYAFMRALTSTLRYRYHDKSGLFDTPTPGPCIYCIWHNRLGLSMKAYFGFARHHRPPTAGMAALVSASRDGGFLTAILECFGVQPVRGSSSRRGPQALLELTTWGKRGYDLAITPDGPRGPRYVVQEGIMALAQITGLPILPFSCHLHWKINVKSWDRFQIPLPFSRCDMNIGPLIHVPREATDAEREAIRLRVQQTLNDLSGD